MSSIPAPSVIAVDGPAASGKTVVGRRLAHRLGYSFLDTGAMYRAVTLLALERKVPLEDSDGLTRIALSMAFEAIEPASDVQSPRVVVNGLDVTSDIRSPSVDRAVSQVSKEPGVRHALVELQRQIARQGRLVMAGRDIGTVVLPAARLKVFLEASAAVRARRRQEEMLRNGLSANYEDVLADLERRDRLDSERVISPLKLAKDAKRINTDGHTIDQVVEKLWTLMATS